SRVHQRVTHHHVQEQSERGVCAQAVALQCRWQSGIVEDRVDALVGETLLTAIPLLVRVSGDETYCELRVFARQLVASVCEYHLRSSWETIPCVAQRVAWTCCC